MPERSVDHTRLDEDWEGNNIAITCPACGKAYIREHSYSSRETGLSEVREVHMYD
jgi:hypothetical protein